MLLLDFLGLTLMLKLNSALPCCFSPLEVNSYVTTAFIGYIPAPVLLLTTNAFENEAFEFFAIDDL